MEYNYKIIHLVFKLRHKSLTEVGLLEHLLHCSRLKGLKLFPRIKSWLSACITDITGKVNITHLELDTAKGKDKKASFSAIITSLDMTGNHSLKILLLNSFQIRMESDLGNEWTSPCSPEDQRCSVPVELAGISGCAVLCYRKPCIESVLICYVISTTCSSYR